MTKSEKKIEQYVTRAFENEQAALPQKTLRKVQQAIALLKEDPQNNERRLDIKKLAEVDGFRVKVDDYRLIYTVKNGAQTFVSVLPRKEVYRKLGITDEEALQVVPDTPLPRRTHSAHNFSNPTVRRAQQLLPHPLSTELLTSWRISDTYHPRLITCQTEDDLLETPLPYPIFSRIVDLLYSKKWAERLSQPQYILSKPTDLEDLAEGNLTTRLLRLDDHQRELSGLGIEEPKNVPVIVRGGPGSGKSTVALYRAKLLVERFPDAAVAYTTYTNALCEASKEQLKMLLPEDHEYVTVSTVDSLALKLVKSIPSQHQNPTIVSATDVLTQTLFTEILGEKPKPLARYSNHYLLCELFDVIEANDLPNETAYLASAREGRKSPMSSANRKLIWALYEKLKEAFASRHILTWSQVRSQALAALSTGTVTPPFDHLIVDEAQDLSHPTLQMLAAMVKEPGGFYVTADANQTLYESRFGWDALREGWPEAQIHTLKKNYRNTAQIVRALGDIREALNLQDEATALVEGTSEGSKPTVIHAQPETAVDALVEYLEQASRESLEPLRYAAILVAGDRLSASERGKELARQLKARGLKANFMSSRNLRLDADCIKIMTMHTSKGLEFPIVALWDVIRGVLPREVQDLPTEERVEEELKDRRLFYVGCSRAMRHLAVLTTQDEESELIYDLQEEHWNEVHI